MITFVSSKSSTNVYLFVMSKRFDSLIKNEPLPRKQVVTVKQVIVGYSAGGASGILVSSIIRQSKLGYQGSSRLRRAYLFSEQVYMAS